MTIKPNSTQSSFAALLPNESEVSLALELTRPPTTVDIAETDSINGDPLVLRIDGKFEEEQVKYAAPQKFVEHLPVLALMLLVNAAAMFNFGYTQYSMNTAQKTFYRWMNESASRTYDYDLTEHNLNMLWTALTTCTFLGLFIGSASISRASEIAGRRGGFIIAGTLEMIGAVISATAIRYNFISMFALGRVIAGIGTGISCGNVAIYVQECAPTAIRGMAACFQEVSVVLATVAGSLLGLDQMLGLHLSSLILVGLVANCTMLVVVTCVLHETPKFLLIGKKNKLDAMAAIRFYHGRSVNVEKVLASYERESNLCDIHPSLGHIISTRHLRRALFIGMAVFTLEVASGIYAVSMFSTYFLTLCGMTHSQAQWATLASTGVNLVATLIAAGIVDRVGRRVILLSADALVSYRGGLLVDNLCDNASPRSISIGRQRTNLHAIGGVVALTAFFVGFSSGPGPIPWFVAAEVVPQSCRAYMMALCQMFNCSSMLLTHAITLPMYDLLGPSSFILIFTIPSIIGWIYLYKRMPETRGRDVADVVMQLMIE